MPAPSQQPPHGGISVLLLYLFILSIRTINAVSIRTFFQPDEYFQSLEPAWKIVFGNGWITWEWREQLRSIAHPMLYAMLYKATEEILNMLKIANPVTRGEVFVIAPRLLQAGFAAAGDLFTFKLARKVLGEEAGWTALFLSLGSAFHWFCSTRTFSNSLEASITIIALYYWPWPARQDKDAAKRNQRNWVADAPESDLKLSLSLAAVACILRPTNALIWATLGMLLLFRASSRAERLYIFGEAVKTGTSALLLNALVDRRYYGGFTFPPYKFLQFNVIQSLSGFYGNNPWHYYLSQGLPLLLTTYTPLAIHEISSVLEKISDVLISNAETRAAERAAKDTQPAQPKPLQDPPKRLKTLSPSLSTRLHLSLTIIITIVVYSLISHKEVRFIYPLLPSLIILTSSSIHNFKSITPVTRRYLVVLLITLNIPIAWYATQVHQRGVIDVVNYLRRDQSYWQSVGFLMPCHSTPWLSSLQIPPTSQKTMWALTCEPPVRISEKERKGYRDEADRFYDDPVGFLKENFPSPPMARKGGNRLKRVHEETKYQWPQRLVFFEVLEREVLSEYLGMRNLTVTKKEMEGEGEKVLLVPRYKRCRNFFNSHFHDDERRKGDVVVYCLMGEEEAVKWY